LGRAASWIAGGVLLGLSAVAVVWAGMYPSNDDPKNIRYVLWKWGLVSIDLDMAVQALTYDPDRNALVVGRTRTELRKEFGYLTPLSKSDSYQRQCFLNSSMTSDAEFVRKSTVLVVFEKDRAREATLLKGC
jgi:hypothetical protein